MNDKLNLITIFKKR